MRAFRDGSFFPRVVVWSLRAHLQEDSLEKRNIPLVQALTLARGACDRPDCRYDSRFCPGYWRRVFILHYGSDPEGDADPRWDALFKEGFPAHRTLFENPAREQAAS